MKEFFKVTPLEKIFEYITQFPIVKTKKTDLINATGKILAEDILSDADIPAFPRSTMDGFATGASSTFGATESNPAYLSLTDTVLMGQSADFSIKQGQASKILTGGMLPKGADSVVMVEHTQTLDPATIEVYKSIAPGNNVVEIGEDFKKKNAVLFRGQILRPQEIGLLAALGIQEVKIYKKPAIGIISTGNELVSIDKSPLPGKIRDINTYTLAAMVHKAGAIPLTFGIVKDDFTAILDKCKTALEKSDLIMISGGSSVGTYDYTAKVLSSLPDSKILAHGISISPGKPTILANVGGKAFWGMPGHVVSAMVVFNIVVLPFIKSIGGLAVKNQEKIRIPAILTRNISSAQGRIDFVRVKLFYDNKTMWAKPVLGKSALLNTMIKADGLIKIDINTEGLDKGTKVFVKLI